MDKLPFQDLYYEAQCPYCEEIVILDLNNEEILLYGFVCENCMNTTNASEMFELLAKDRNV